MRDNGHAVARACAWHDFCMVMITWPVPYNGEPNDFEIVGRYIAQTILMERFIDSVLLNHGTKPHDLMRMKLARKIEEVRDIISKPDSGVSEWSGLPDMMKKVAGNRNQFAHRMMQRGAIPSHYAQGLSYEALSVADLREQEREAFSASELCRQLADHYILSPLNEGKRFGRTDPTWPPRFCSSAGSQ